MRVVKAAEQKEGNELCPIKFSEKDVELLHSYPLK